MGIKANWFSEVAVVQGDPFTEAPAPPAPPRLRSAAELEEVIGKQLSLEAELFAKGLSCPVKSHRDTTCSACALHGSFAKLCDLGRKQEKTLNEYVLIRHGGEVRKATTAVEHYGSEEALVQAFIVAFDATEL